MCPYIFLGTRCEKPMSRRIFLRVWGGVGWVWGEFGFCWALIPIIAPVRFLGAPGRPYMSARWYRGVGSPGAVEPGCFRGIGVLRYYLRIPWGPEMPSGPGVPTHAGASGTEAKVHTLYFPVIIGLNVAIDYSLPPSATAGIRCGHIRPCVGYGNPKFVRRTSSI